MEGGQGVEVAGDDVDVGVACCEGGEGGGGGWGADEGEDEVGGGGGELADKLELRGGMRCQSCMYAGRKSTE